MTTYTPNSALAKPATADRNWGAILNGNADQLDAVAAIGQLAVTPQQIPSTTLLVNVASGAFINNSGVYSTYAGVLGFAVTASVTNYLWLTNAGVLASGTAWPTSGTLHLRLAVVVAGGTTLTGILDARTPFRVGAS